jgi:hypothetical protein
MVPPLWERPYRLRERFSVLHAPLTRPEYSLARKLLPRNDQWKAPTPDLEGHRKRLREALGNTLSDEFVDVILGKLVEALRPGLYDQLEEATLNAALATIDSMQPRSELKVPNARLEQACTSAGGVTPSAGAICFAWG